MAEQTSVDRPTLADLELMETLNVVFPAKSIAEAARRSEGRYSPQGLKSAIDRVSEFCKEEITKQDGEYWKLSRTGEHLRDYALVILRTHREIRVWPPVYHLVIGASHRTAASFLPSLLARFFEVADTPNSPMPFQITVRESDSREEFFAALRNGDADLGLRGLPLSEEEVGGTPVPDDLLATPFGPAFRLLAVSKKPLPKQVSVIDLLKKGRVGILKMDVESVLTLLSKSGEHVFFPQRNILTCDSYVAMMSFINSSLCTGLIYVPPHVTSIPGLHLAELTDLPSSTRCFVFCKSSLFSRLSKVEYPADRHHWSREHYLAKLREVFWDESTQQKALKPSFEPFPFM